MEVIREGPLGATYVLRALSLQKETLLLRHGQLDIGNTLGQTNDILCIVAEG